MNGYGISIQGDAYSREHLLSRVRWILDLMDKEHKNCSTHAQRNNYQAVIRHELEIMQDELEAMRTVEVSVARVSDIPF